MLSLPKQPVDPACTVVRIRYDGALDALPFSALARNPVGRATFQYLVDWKPLVFAPSVVSAAAWNAGDLEAQLAVYDEEAELQVAPEQMLDQGVRGSDVYVACTRATQQLHLIDLLPDDPA